MNSSEVPCDSGLNQHQCTLAELIPDVIETEEELYRQTEWGVCSITDPLSRSGTISSCGEHSLSRRGLIFLRQGNCVKASNDYFRKFESNKCCLKLVVGPKIMTKQLRLVKADDVSSEITEADASVEDHEYMDNQLSDEESRAFTLALHCAMCPLLTTEKTKKSFGSLPRRLPSNSIENFNDEQLEVDVPSGAMTLNRNYTNRRHAEARKADHRKPMNSDVNSDSSIASSDLLIEKLFQAFDLQISLLPHYRKSILKSRNTTNAAQILAEDLCFHLSMMETCSHPYYNSSSFLSPKGYEKWRYVCRKETIGLINSFWHSQIPPVGNSAKFDGEKIHSDYRTVLHKLIGYEQKFHRSTSDDLGEVFHLSNCSKRLLTEFRLRFGIDEIFCKTVFLEYHILNFDTSQQFIENVIELVKELLELLQKDKDGSNLLKQQVEQLTRCCERLISRCEDMFSHLQTSFSSPNCSASAASLLNLLECVMNLKARLAPQVSNNSIGDLLMGYLMMNFNVVYENHRTDTLVLETKTQKVSRIISPKSINHLLSRIRDEVSYYKSKYQQVFERYLDITEQASTRLYDLLMKDVLSLCSSYNEQQQQQRSNGKIDYLMVGLMYRLDMLDSDWKSHIPRSKQVWRREFFQHVNNWLTIAHRYSETLLMNAIAQDKYKPLRTPSSIRYLPNGQSFSERSSSTVLTRSDSSAFIPCKRNKIASCSQNKLKFNSSMEHDTRNNLKSNHLDGNSTDVDHRNVQSSDILSRAAVSTLAVTVNQSTDPPAVSVEQTNSEHIVSEEETKSKSSLIVEEILADIIDSILVNSNENQSDKGERCLPIKSSVADDHSRTSKINEDEKVFEFPNLKVVSRLACQEQDSVNESHVAPKPAQKSFPPREISEEQNRVRPSGSNVLQDSSKTIIHPANKTGELERQYSNTSSSCVSLRHCDIRRCVPNSLPDPNLDEKKYSANFSSSVIDLLCLVQRLSHLTDMFAKSLCTSDDVSDADLDNSRSIRDFNKQLYTNLYQTIESLVHVYAKNMLAMDICALSKSVASQLIGNAFIGEIKILHRDRNLIWGCRHKVKGTNCFKYVNRRSEFGLEVFEPISEEMCVRLNNLSQLSNSLKLFLKHCFKHCNLPGNQCCSDPLYLPVSQCNFDENFRPIGTFLDSAVHGLINILAHRMSLYINESLTWILKSSRDKRSNLEAVMESLNRYITDHLQWLQRHLCTADYLKVFDRLWSSIAKYFEQRTRELKDKLDDADGNAKFLLKIIANLTNRVAGLHTSFNVDDVILHVTTVMHWLQLYTESTKRLVNIYNLLCNKKEILSYGNEEGGGEKARNRLLRSMQKSLHSNRKSFSGQQLVEWIGQNSDLVRKLCKCPGWNDGEELHSTNVDPKSNMPLANQPGIDVCPEHWAQQLLETGIVIPVDSAMDRSSNFAHPPFPILRCYSTIQTSEEDDMVIIERGESKFESEIKPKSGETNENRSKIPDPKRSGVGELTGRGDSQPNTSNFIDDSERFHSTSHKGMTFDEESYQFSASRLYRMSSLNEEVTSSYGAVDYVSSDGTCQKFRCLQYYMRRRVSRELLLTILASRKKGDSDAQQFINQLPKEVTGKYPWLFVRQHSVLACLGLRLSMLTNTL